MGADSIHTSGQVIAGANKPGYIPVLDGWRAVAIILVLIYHSLIHAELPASGPLYQVARLFEHLGPFGVLVFFTISGYLITGRLIADHKRTGKLSLQEFYYKRAFRILPLSYFYLATIAIASLFHLTQFTWRDSAAAIFMANYVAGHSWNTAHFWSLSIEEHFYLVWPPIIALVGWRRAFWVGVTLILAEAAWRPWVLQHAADRFLALERTDMRIDFLMVGSVIAVAVAEWPVVRQWLERAGSPFGCLCAIVALGATVLPWPFDTRSLQALILAAMVCGTAVSRSHLIHRLLANRWMLFIGQISYSLYILQQPFFGEFTTPWLNKPTVEFCKLFLVFGLAYLSYRYIEQPFIRYARRRNQKKEAAATASASPA